jgi:TRAP-type uncharacterized transport system, fused permease components
VVSSLCMIVALAFALENYALHRLQPIERLCFAACVPLILYKSGVTSALAVVLFVLALLWHYRRVRREAAPVS